MPPSTPYRDALKARHRQAIVDAAAALLRERGGERFGVDELATRAEVARRTVFNHFGSLDDVLLAVCEDALAGVIDDLVAELAASSVGADTRASMFDEVAHALSGADLPRVIATIHGVLGDPATSDGKAAVLAQTAFARVTDRIRAEVLRRHPSADELVVALLVGSLMSGAIVVGSHWVERTGGRLDDGSRAEWARLLARLVHEIRSGYAPAN